MCCACSRSSRHCCSAHGVAATYVGHPLADAIPLEPPRAAARRALGLAEADAVVAVLPGSRRSEIEYDRADLPAGRGRGCMASGRRCASCCRWRPACGPLLDAAAAAHAPGVPLLWLDGRSHEALAACDLTLIASGTATLEAALFKRPMVIGYRMHPLSWQLMKRMALQPWVGLPNILCRDFVVPERIQAQLRAGDAGRRRAGRPGRQPQAPTRLRQRFTDTAP